MGICLVAKIGQKSWIVGVRYDEPVTILSYLKFNAHQVIHDILYSMILSHPMFVFRRSNPMFVWTRYYIQMTKISLCDLGWW